MTIRNLLKKAIWLSDKQKCDLFLFEMIRPVREVSKNPRYKNGTFYSEKNKRNIQHESGLELKFIEKLENEKSVIAYCDQPKRLKFRIAGKPQKIYLAILHYSQKNRK